MLKNIRKVTMLLFIAATMFSFSSCNKDNNNENSNNNDTNGTNVSGTIGGHDYVDMGLSVKWANCNLGTSNPLDLGNQYAWGETYVKGEYSWQNYMCGVDQCGTSSDPIYVAGLRDISGTQFDVAKTTWGNGWRMPTEEHFRTLVDNCTWTFGQKDGVYGYTVTATNGNSIFLPRAEYWTSSMYGDDYELWNKSWFFGAWPMNSGVLFGRDVLHRYEGLVVRPVHE